MPRNYRSVSCYITRMGGGYLEVTTENGNVETYYVYSSDWEAFVAYVTQKASEWLLLDVDDAGYVVGWQ